MAWTFFDDERKVKAHHAEHLLPRGVPMDSLGDALQWAADQFCDYFDDLPC
jgi:hypothetical protein